jgi:hypothetical protein
MIASVRNKNRTESGFLSIEWVVGIALLVIPSFILAISILQYPPRKNLTQVTASESARAFTQAQSSSEAVASAREAAKATIDNELPSNKYTDSEEHLDRVVKIEIPNYCSGNEVKITITLPMPLLSNPFSESEKALFNGKDVSSSATERIDDYREIEQSDTCPE